MHYVQLTSTNDLPDISSLRPFKAIVVIEVFVTPERQATISGWLVESGCLYMMAWGLDCSSWDDSVDIANLESFDFGSIPEDRFVITTWHESETLEDVFKFSKQAIHKSVCLENLVFVHLCPVSKEEEWVRAYSTGGQKREA